MWANACSNIRLYKESTLFPTMSNPIPDSVLAYIHYLHIPFIIWFYSQAGSCRFFQEPFYSHFPGWGRSCYWTRSTHFCDWFAPEEWSASPGWRSQAIGTGPEVPYQQTEWLGWVVVYLDLWGNGIFCCYGQITGWFILWIPKHGIVGDKC